MAIWLVNASLIFALPQITMFHFGELLSSIITLDPGIIVDHHHHICIIQWTEEISDAYPMWHPPGNYLSWSLRRDVIRKREETSKSEWAVRFQAVQKGHCQKTWERFLLSFQVRLCNI